MYVGTSPSPVLHLQMKAKKKREKDRCRWALTLALRMEGYIPCLASSSTRAVQRTPTPRKPPSRPPPPPGLPSPVPPHPIFQVSAATHAEYIHVCNMHMYVPTYIHEHDAYLLCTYICTGNCCTSGQHCMQILERLPAENATQERFLLDSMVRTWERGRGGLDSWLMWMRMRLRLEGLGDPGWRFPERRWCLRHASYMCCIIGTLIHTNCPVRITEYIQYSNRGILVHCSIMNLWLLCV